LIFEAARDFHYFQNRSYPRISALDWTGNRYALSRNERDMLRRGVFGREEALRRHIKQWQGSDWQNEWLIVDGHNVHITIESALLGRPLLRANDGALRDLAGLSARFRLSEVSERVIDMVIAFLNLHPPRKILFLFDAPMSHSGLLAAEYRRRLARLGLPGEALTVPVPERLFLYDEAVIASSDQEVLDKSRNWLDLAFKVLETSVGVQLTVDFSNIVCATGANEGMPQACAMFCPP
jgi:hypothetical protein